APSRSLRRAAARARVPTRPVPFGSQHQWRERSIHMTLSYRSAGRGTKAAKEDIMFKRTLMIAVALTFPIALAAQEPPPIAIVAHVLSLSDDQVHALADFLQARGEALRPTAEALQAHQAALAQ